MKGILKDILVCMLVIFFIGASVFPIISGQGETYFHANQDIPIQNGGISGSYVNTQNSDDSYEGISERESGGKPSNRYSYLEHKWTFSLSGSFNTINFYIEAYHTANSEGDDFVFAYSTNDVSYTNILTVTKTSDDDNYQSAELPNTLSGTIYVRVRDTDRSRGNRALDTIFIDHMYIVGDSGADVTPPVISNVDSSVNENTWYNLNPTIVGGELTPREYPAMAYNASAQRVIMFDGMNIKDTWAYDYATNTWTEMSSLPSYSEVGGTLIGRDAHDMVYDPDTDMTIMFGGQSIGGIILKDTWSYDYATNTWTNLTSLPSYSEVGGTLLERCWIDMAYDSSAKRIILHGGHNEDVEGLNDTWAYDAVNNTWFNLNPAVVGGPMYKTWISALVYDSSADRTIMFGGLQEEPGYIYTDETWVYDYNANTWYKMDPEVIGGTLLQRAGHVMVYDSYTQRTVMFSGKWTNEGGAYDLNDTWFYDYSENTWSNASYNVVGGWLAPRECAGMIYNSAEQNIILFGGWSVSLNFGDCLGDTWELIMDDLTATITWTTDEPSDSVVNYGNTTALGLTVSDSALVTEHQIAITEVIPDITYYFEVQSTDSEGNTATDDNNGNYYTFFTGTDAAPPVISNVQTSDITHNSGTVTWNTDESSNSRVNYGTTTDLGDTKADSAMVTSHSIVLTDLLPETTYFFELQSTDGEGNMATDDNNGSYYSFTTDSEPDVDEMHVDSISMWYEPAKKKYIVYTEATIVDTIGSPVEGASVYLEVLDPVGNIQYFNDVTAADGTVTFVHGPTPKTGTFTSTVTDVVKSGWRLPMW